MASRTSYWIGKRPSNGKKWAYTTSATALEVAGYHEALFRMYRRYVKQWNDIELNKNWSLSEHIHEVCGAKIVGGPGRCFILHWHNDSNDHWILELCFARDFSEFYPGLSCGRNPFRSTNDIRTARLHWSGRGREEFERWLVSEKEVNQKNGEWEEYRA